MRINPKLFAILGLLLILGYFLQDLVFNDGQYAARLRKARKEKNDGFRLVQGSPLNEKQRNTFDSLNYYEPDKAYRFEAQLEHFPRPDTVELPLTDGKADKYLRWGQATFNLNQQDYKLTLYLKANGQDSPLFIPFTDRTNGHATYGGGRYLDVALPTATDKELVLDFNTAYNPYCAYNDTYACPVPPLDNRLPVEIKAGEKFYK